MTESEQKLKFNISKGHEVIKSYLKTLDGSPGVYRMLNQDGEVLYVGKAINLKRRVSNHPPNSCRMPCRLSII